MKNQTKETHVYNLNDFMGNLVEDPTDEEIVRAVDETGGYEVVYRPNNFSYFLIPHPEVCVFIKPGDEYPDGITAPADCDEKLVT